MYVFLVFGFPERIKKVFLWFNNVKNEIFIIFTCGKHLFVFCYYVLDFIFINLLKRILKYVIYIKISEILIF